MEYLETYTEHCSKDANWDISQGATFPQSHKPIRDGADLHISAPRVNHVHDIGQSTSDIFAFFLPATLRF